jgi:hypothetical protein
MSFFRITKYNPKFRLENGSYKKPEWTSVSDIGRIYQDGQFSVDDYIETENAYVASVVSLLLQANCQFLQVQNLALIENYESLPKHLVSDSKKMLPLFQENAAISGELIEWAVRLNLRELIWCRLQGNNGVYIHFGYDYYMYFGIESNGFCLPSLPAKIFAEEIESPYKLI